MKKRQHWIVVLLSIVFVIAYACQDQSFDPTDSGPNKAVGPQQIAGQAPSEINQMQRNFRTHLNGQNVVPSVDTQAQGEAIFHVSKNGMEISYKLTAANIENLLMAHIHIGTPDGNGPVVVWLYPKQGPPPQLIDGRFDGVLAEGTITADDLIGELEGDPLDSLVTHLRNGSAYVQAHTEQNKAGEIRGQIH